MPSLTLPRKTLPFWSDVTDARSFLKMLAFGAVQSNGSDLSLSEPLTPYVEWIVAHELGPLVAHRYQRLAPHLAAKLQKDAYAALAENSLHLQLLTEITQTLAEAGHDLVLLKGIALAETVYDGVGLRTMSDIDIWVHGDEIETAVTKLCDSGFKMSNNDKRPLALQILAKGEVQLYRPDWVGMLAELHWSPFPGWWLRQTADIDHDGLWSRIKPLPSLGENVYQLAPEDMIIQMAVHLSVSHQFSIMTVRGLVDIAMLSSKQSVDWMVLAQRAKQWRVATAVYLVLLMVDEMIGLPTLKECLATLQPSFIKRPLLKQFVSPQKLLAGHEIRYSALRYLFMILLVDRKRDAVKLIGRAIWPEKSWLLARYGKPTTPWQHLWRLVRKREL